MEDSQRAAKTRRLAPEEEAHQALSHEHSLLQEQFREMKKSAEAERLRQPGEFLEMEQALSKAEASIAQSQSHAETELSEHSHAKAQLQRTKAEADMFRESA